MRPRPGLLPTRWRPVGRMLLLPLLVVVCLAGAGSAVAATRAGGAAGQTTVVSGSASSSAGLQSSSNTDDGTHWATSVPAFQQPTDKTNNEPLLIIGTALLAIVVIGGLAALVRLRVRPDDADL